MDGKTTKDSELLKLSLGDVIEMHVRRSGKSWDEVGALMGWGPSQTSRVRDKSDNYWFSLPNLGAFCLHTRCTLILEWALASAQAGGVRRDFADMDCQTLVFSLGGLFRELGDVARVGERAVADGAIQQAEARRLIRELYDVIERAMEAVAGLRGPAGYDG